MKTIIYTSFPCLIKFEEQQESLTQNENLVIEEDFKKVVVYPTERGRIAFEVNVDEQENTFYRIIEHGGKRLVFLLDGIYAENAEIYEFDYEGIKSKAEIYPQKVVFSGSESKKIIHLVEKYKSFKSGNIKHIDYCILENINGKTTLLAYNAKNNTAKMFNANEILEEQNGFILKNSAYGYTSISQHLYIDEEGLKIRKKEGYHHARIYIQDSYRNRFWRKHREQNRRPGEKVRRKPCSDCLRRRQCHPLRSHGPCHRLSGGGGGGVSSLWRRAAQPHPEQGGGRREGSHRHGSRHDPGRGRRQRH